MLENIERKATEDTPYILLRADGYCKFEGDSYPEDIATFYIPIVKWFEKYEREGRNDMVMDMKLHYFNSASSKIFIEIFERLYKYTGKSIVVNWYYPENDEEILESGKIYQGISNLEFNYIPY
jgi:hypothetical protein